MTQSFGFRGMLMSSVMASLLVACGPEQEPAADVEVSERSEVTTLAQALTSNVPVSLINRGSGKCMDIAGNNMKNGAALYLWSCLGGANQKFTLQPDGAGYYSLVAQHSGLCLSVGYYNTQRGAALYQYNCIGHDNQKFDFIDLGTGYYNLRPKQQTTMVSVHDNWDNGALIAVGLGVGASAEFRLGL